MGARYVGWMPKAGVLLFKLKFTPVKNHGQGFHPNGKEIAYTAKNY